MDRWITFIRERFPLIPQLSFIVGMTLIAYRSESVFSLAWVFLGLLLFFFLLRSMDEFKDFEKDCVAHPERPLPRGLISKNEMEKLIQSLMFGMGVYSIFVGWMINLAAGFAYLIITLYLWAMYHEFNLKSYLATRPLIYALSHQLIIVPITAFLVAAGGKNALFSVHTLLSAGALFSGFFAYEISRKLNPAAHPILKTYPQIYGKNRTLLIAVTILFVQCLCSYFLAISYILWPVGFLLLYGMIGYWFNPIQFKNVDNISKVNLLTCIYTLGIRAVTVVMA
jgi:4-hydroxybenzoate polyprenyltransferase